MSFILGMSEGSQVAIGLGLLTLIISAVSAFIIMKTKTDKGEILIEVDRKIDEKILPIERKLEKHEESINDIKIKQAVIHKDVGHILTGQEDIKKLIGTLFDKLDSKKDK